MFSHSLLISCINSSIWSIDGTLTNITIPSQSEPGSNGNEELFHIPQISMSGALPSDGLVSYPAHTFAHS